MANGMSREALEQASRWIDEAPRNLAALTGIINDYNPMRERVEVAEREKERLEGLVEKNEQVRNRLETSEHERERLDEEVSRLRSAIERQLQEREEIADSLTTFINRARARLRGQQFEAGSVQGCGRNAGRP